MRRGDRLLRMLFAVGIGFLSLVAVAFVLHRSGTELYRPLSDAFEGGAAWRETQARGDSPEKAKAQGELDIDADPDIDAATDDMPPPGRIAHGRQPAYPGYTLIGMASSFIVQLIDMDGAVLHTWNVPFRKAWPHPTHVSKSSPRVALGKTYVFPNGDLLAQYSGMGDTPYGYGIARFDKNSELLWAYSQNAHHDFYVSPASGTIYALIHQFVRQPVKGLEYLEYPILNDYIATLAPDGRETDRISIADAFTGTPYESLLSAATGKSWDPVHANTVMLLEKDIAGKFPMFRPGSFLVSLRNISAIAVIDPDTKKIVWLWQGPWLFQHAVHFLPNGHILLLDNSSTKRRKQSHILELDPARRVTTWSYSGAPDDRFFTYAWGRLQRLPNGNTLAAEAAAGKIKEIAPNGDIAWSYEFPKRPSGRNSVVTTANRYDRPDLPFVTTGK
jgi:hypothetical protein